MDSSVGNLPFGALKQLRRTKMSNPSIKDVTSIPKEEADHLHKIRIEVSGVNSAEAAKAIALRGVIIPEGFTTDDVEFEKTDNGYAFYPYLCCWRTKYGDVVYGYAWFKYCEPEGYGCPA